MSWEGSSGELGAAKADSDMGLERLDTGAFSAGGIYGLCISWGKGKRGILLLLGGKKLKGYLSGINIHQ